MSVIMQLFKYVLIFHNSMTALSPLNMITLIGRLLFKDFIKRFFFNVSLWEHVFRTDLDQRLNRVVGE